MVGSALLAVIALMLAVAMYAGDEMDD